jgi:hypothetical protein
MASLKYEYPYIKFLSLQDKKDYQSDLPENMDDFEVFHIKSSPLYREQMNSFFKSNVYWTEEQRKEHSSMFDNRAFWFLCVNLVLARSMLKSKDLYNTNILINYKVYSSENWMKYFKSRSYYIATAAVLCTHFWYFQGNFRDYPKVIS